ncbi:MAG TPA: hypothetical protein VIY52_18280 [Streptosporangiaceae bacterium]
MLNAVTEDLFEAPSPASATYPSPVSADYGKPLGHEEEGEPPSPGGDGEPGAEALRQKLAHNVVEAADLPPGYQLVQHIVSS